MSQENQSPVAIVTASGKGIGKGIAQRLSEEGYQLGLMSSSGSAEELAGILPNAIGLQGSVTEMKSMEQLFDRTMEKFGRIDAIVNNTGHPPKGDLIDIPLSDWQLGFDLIMKSVIISSQLATKVFQQQGGAVS